MKQFILPGVAALASLLPYTTQAETLWAFSEFSMYNNTRQTLTVELKVDGIWDPVDSILLAPGEGVTRKDFEQGKRNDAYQLRYENDVRLDKRQDHFFSVWVKTPDGEAVEVLEAKHEYMRDYPDQNNSVCRILGSEYTSGEFSESYYRQTQQGNGCYHYLQIR